MNKEKYYFVDLSVLIDNLECLDEIENIIVLDHALSVLEEYKRFSASKYLASKAKIALDYLRNRDVIIGLNVTGEIDIRKKFNLIGEPVTYSIAAYGFNEAYDYNVIFLTHNMYEYTIAKDILGLNVEWAKQLIHEEYKGYKEITMDEESMAYFYEHLEDNKYGCNINEYLLIKNTNDVIVDSYKWNGDVFISVKQETFKTDMFGDIKPYNGDYYQRCLFDSLKNNKLTLVKGHAGVGKSVCSFGYLMYLLEKNKIDKIVCFTNTVPTYNSARMGFYPGSRNEKLKESSIGNILSSKLGDSSQIDRMIDDHELLLVPMCDIRGFDTSGMRCGVWITEAQNMDIYLMKLALQRVGEDSICIVDGDYDAQVDNSEYAGKNNGMRRLSEVFRGQPFYGEIELKNIYRSKIAKIADLM